MMALPTFSSQSNNFIDAAHPKVIPFLVKFLDLNQDQQVCGLFEKLSHQEVDLIFEILQHIEPSPQKSSLPLKIQRQALPRPSLPA